MYIRIYNVIIHTMCICSLFDYADILECPLSSSPLVYRMEIGLCSVHKTDAAIDASPVNEYSSIKLQIC